jgi:predicted type IV restriction endonuclease
MENKFADWGEASATFDEIYEFARQHDLTGANEAQTRYDVIDRIVQQVLGWKYGQVKVEEHVKGSKSGYVDYLLVAGDRIILIEAKKVGATFPSPTKCKKLKFSGTILANGEIAEAVGQANGYATDKDADVVIVTNGQCWCFYAFKTMTKDAYATLLFPFDNPSDAEQLFVLFAEQNVEFGSLEKVTNELPRTEDRLLTEIADSDGRVDRNNIADHIVPALNLALYADALLSNEDSLRRCFVTSDARTKFDNYLQINLNDYKPDAVQPAKRIKRGKEQDHLEKIIESSVTSHAPPVTLIIGCVGAGKSTYLKHFEKISGAAMLQKKSTHWVNIDFEEMGRQGNPRLFMYEKLKNYLAAEHPENPTDYKHAVEPAYSGEIAGLARGPLSPIFN